MQQKNVMQQTFIIS